MLKAVRMFRTHLFSLDIEPSKDGEDPYAEPKARGMFIKVEIVDQYESGFHLGCG